MRDTRVLIAPDKFKGTLSASAVAEHLAAGVRDVIPDVRIDVCPVADGGEGFVDALVSAAGGRRITRRVTGPLPHMRVDATFGLIPDVSRPDRPLSVAVIEMAAASGLALLRPEERDPEAMTTYGTGELLRHAVAMECGHVILGIGGSATCDAGIGCLQACGVPVLLDRGETVHDTDPLCGRDVGDVVLIKRGRGSAVDGVSMTVACDVTNPLLGPNGAARVYGPQKGATPEQIERLEAAMARLVARTGTRGIADRPGSGAAGGIAYGLAAFLDARLSAGFDLVAKAVGLDARVASADVCLTGEGRFDSSSLSGKTVAGIAGMCQAVGVPCVVIAGSVDDSLDLAGTGIAGTFGLTANGLSVEAAMADTPRLLRERAAEAVRAWRQDVPHRR